MKITSLDEDLKNALAVNDIAWLKAHENEFDVDHRFADCENDTLLLYAISDAKSEAYHYLLQKQAAVFLRNDQGETTFHALVYAGIPDRFDVLLKYSPNALSLLNERTHEGVTPLLLAVLLENYPVCDYLLRLGADVNIVDNTHNAPIHPACFYGNLAIVKLLVEHHADLNAKTDKGNLPLALAVNGNHDAVAKYLLSYTDVLKSSSAN